MAYFKKEKKTRNNLLTRTQGHAITYLQGLFVTPRMGSRMHYTHEKTTISSVVYSSLPVFG